jgi:hypothetical protein
MNKKTLRTALIAGLAGALGMTSTIVRADVTITRSTSIEGLGGMTLANSTGTTTTSISGDKSRTVTETKMQSKLIGFLARGAAGPTAEIVLLDDGKIYHLNLNKKEYTETTFDQLRSQMQQAQDQMKSNTDKAQDKSQQQPTAVDQSKCVWLPAKVSVNKTGETAQIAGYDSQRTIVTATQPCQDMDSGSICDITLVLDMWNSAGFSESSEARKYYSAYATKMGFDAATLQDSSQRAKAMFSQYQGIWTEVAGKMASIKGYPVKNGFTMAMGGAQCKDPKAQQNQSSDSDSSSNNGGGLAGALAGGLGGLFHKKSDSDAPAAQAAPATPPVPLPPGEVALMTVTTQLVSVSTDNVSPDSFTVPADFKKQ